MKAISIIIPAYNVERYVDSCMVSLMNQTLQDFEVIIINDGSTDNTLELFEGYREKIENLVIINQENTGSAGKPRNIGIEKAVGKYIFCLDPDDEIFPYTLELMYKEAEKEQADLVVGNMLYFNNTSTWFNKKICEELYTDSVNTDIKNKPELFMSLGPCNKLYLRKLITDNEIKFSEDIRMGEDQKFVIGAYINARKIRILKENVYKYRRREEDDKSASQEITLKALRDCVTAHIINYNIIEKCKDKDLQLECQKKRIKYEFLRYIDQLLDAPFDEELIEVIEGYAQILEEAHNYSNLSILDRLKIKYIKLKQYDKLLQIINYQRISDKYAYTVKNKRLYLDRNSIEVDIDFEDDIEILDEEVKAYIGIEKNKYSKGILDLEGWIYIERLNMPSALDISKMIVLEHESGKEHITYNLKNVIRKDITKSRGKNLYTYDGSGFKGQINLLDLLKESNKFGEWKIKIVLQIGEFYYSHCFKTIKRDFKIKEYGDLDTNKLVCSLDRSGVSEGYLIQNEDKRELINKVNCIADIMNNPIYQRIEDIRYENNSIYFKGWIYVEGEALGDLHKVKKTLVLVNDRTQEEIQYKCTNLISQWGPTQIEYNIWGIDYTYAGWEVRVPYDAFVEGGYIPYIDYQVQGIARRCKLQYMSWKLYKDRTFIEQVRYHRGNSIQLIYTGNNFDMEETSFYMYIRPTTYRNNNEFVAYCTSMQFTEGAIVLKGYAFIEGQEQLEEGSNKKSLVIVTQDGKLYKKMTSTSSIWWNGTKNEVLNPHGFQYSYGTWEVELDKKEFEEYLLGEYKLSVRMEQNGLEGEIELQVKDEFKEGYTHCLEQSYKITNNRYLAPELHDNVLNLKVIDMPKVISFIKEINYYKKHMQLKGIVISPVNIGDLEREIQFNDRRFKLDKLTREVVFDFSDEQIILPHMSYYSFEINRQYDDFMDMGNIELYLAFQAGNKEIKSPIHISSQDENRLEDYFIKGHQYEGKQIKGRIEQNRFNLIIWENYQEQIGETFYVTNLKLTKEGIYIGGKLTNPTYDFSDSGYYVSYLKMRELTTDEEIFIESKILEDNTILNDNMEKATYACIENFLRFDDIEQGKYIISIQTNNITGVSHYDYIENHTFIKENSILYYDKNKKITLSSLDNQEFIFEVKSNWINWLFYVRQTIVNRIKGNENFRKKINQINKSKISLEDRLGHLIDKKLKEKIKNRAKKWINRITTKEEVYELSYKLFKKLPINKDKVIFTSYKDTVSVNYISILEELNNQKLNKQIIHLLGNKDFSIYELVKRAYHLATASIVILEDYHRFLYRLDHRKETRFIQIWHAAGAFKKFGFSSLGKKDSVNIDFEKKAHKFYTDVIASSNFIIPFYAEAFNIEQNRIKAIGVPRTDMLFDMDKKKDVVKKIYDRYPILKGKKIILYAPTFRGNSRERVNFYNPIELDQMKFLRDENAILLYKVHPICAKSCVIPDEYKEFAMNISDYPDINELFFITDLLITDYSSVVFEYAIFNKPIVFYAYDLESYLGERDFYYDYNEFTPGAIVKNTSELIECIKSYNGHWYQDNTKFINKFFDNNLDGNVAKRFVDLYIKGKNDE